MSLKIMVPPHLGSIMQGPDCYNSSKLLILVMKNPQYDEKELMDSEFTKLNYMWER